MPRNRRLKKLANRKRSQKSRRARRLRHEPLEKRDLLAVVTVDTVLDVVDINDGVTSLREAIFATNTVPGADEIVFDFGFDGPATIVLTEGELSITDSLTITGDGPELLTIDASGNDPTPDVDNGDGSRVFSVRDFDSSNTLEVTIQGVTLTGGDAAGDGGAILSSEALTIVDSVITENHAALSGGGVSSSTFTGDLVISGSIISDNSTGVGNGGGLSAGRLVMEDSQVTGNVTDFSGGGIALAGREATIRNSQITGNETIRGAGGGISLTSSRGGTPSLLLTGSVVSDNTAAAEGGGIRSSYSGGLTIRESHIARNYAGDLGGGLAAFSSAVLVVDSSFDSNVTERQGGGIASYTSGNFERPFEIINSTIARNRAEVNGGGVYVEARGLVDFAMRHSTVVNNEVDLDLGELSALLGGGIVAADTEVVLDHTIVFDNSVFGGASDLTAFEGSFTVESSAIGAIAPGTQAFLNNTQLGIDPLLSGPLGGVGPTLVYELQPGSPAIDAGDPAVMAGMDGVPAFDQRGPFFFRQQSVIDIGAFEVQPEVLGEVSADFDGDGDVDGRDFLILQRNLGATGLGEDSLAFGDADGDGDVDHNDRLAWEFLFGEGEIDGGVFEAALAIEAEEPPPVVFVDTDLDVVDFDDGGLSLREAVFVTNIVSGLQEIQFAFDVDGPVSIVLTEGELQIKDSLIITGDSADLLTIDASGNDPTPEENNSDGSRVLNINDGSFPENSRVAITGVTITGGDSGSGAGIFSTEELYLERVVVTDNHGGAGARSQGGGINSNNSLTVVDSVVSNNSVGGRGGGIFSSGDLLSISETDITGNTGSDGGGVAVVVLGGFVEILGGSISENTATADGGGVSVFGRSSSNVEADQVLVIDGTRLEDNTAGGNGGAVSLEANHFRAGYTLHGINASGNEAEQLGGGMAIVGENGEVLIEESFFSLNTSGGGGGGLAIFQESSSDPDRSLDVAIDGSFFRSNTAEEGGGIAANLSTSTLRIDSSTIVGNDALGRGGGLFASGGPADETVVLTGSSVNNNNAEEGGGVWIEGGLAVEGSDIQSNDALQDAGGVFAESLWMTDSTLAENTAAEGFGGGLRLGPGAAAITGSTIEANHALRGGGVYANGGQTLMIEESLVSENTAEDGGGLYVFFTDTLISGSTFTENTATNRGGGTYFLTPGGASDEIVNSTFSANHADHLGGGIYAIGRGLAELAIRHTTVYGNTAGQEDLEAAGSGAGVFIQNIEGELDHSIVFENSLIDGAQEDIAEVGGEFLVESSLIGTIQPGTQATLNDSLLGIDPLLGPLQNNGGPTPTHVPSLNSPVIDAGDLLLVAGVDGVPEFDQRGEPFDRVSGQAIDIGAVEVQQITLQAVQAAQRQQTQGGQGDSDGTTALAAALALVAPTIEDDVPTVVVTTTEDVVDFNDGVTSLREAVFAANTVPGPQKIEFVFPFLDPLGQATLVLTEGELVVTDSVIIDGGSAELVTIDASGNDPTPDEDNRDGSRVMRVESLGLDPIDVTLRGLTLTGGDTNSVGGAVFSTSNLLLDGVAVEDNRAVQGGGIYSSPVNGAFGLKIVDSTLSGNRATGGGRTGADGGAVLVRGGLHVEDSLFSENRAWNGAGVAAQDHEVTISGSTFVGNQATGSGGGLHFFQTREESLIENSTFSGNEALRGGGMYALSRSAAPIVVRHSTFTENRLLPLAGGVPESEYFDGGGVYFRNLRGEFTLDHTIVAGNFNGNGQADDFLISSSFSQPLAEVESSLIGVIAPGTQAVLNNTQLGVGALLGPSQDNGGPTPTHALLPGSFAIDAGDASLVAGVDGVPEFDQRGESFDRVSGPAIDIGAFEVQQIAQLEGQQQQNQQMQGQQRDDEREPDDDDRLAVIDEAFVSALAAAVEEQNESGPQRPEGEDSAELDRAFAQWVS
ncbi:MAG: choice-of-anchor Q domain-containing protein [Planctomycetota bacterium]